MYPGAPPQTVSFDLNGTTTGPGVPLRPGPADYEVAMPAGAARAGWNRLVVHYAYARAPRDVLPSSDGRPLAVAWNSIRLAGDGRRPDPPSADGRRGELVLPAGTSVSYPVHLARGAVLTFADVLFPPDPGTTLTVRVDADRGRSTVLARLDRSDRTRAVSVPDDWTGIVRLSLEVRGTSATTVRLVRPALRWQPDPRDARSTPNGTARRPSILIYLVDTLRADRLGCYGHDGHTSPRLDEFAGHAVVFDDAVADSSWTRASVASLVSGLSARVHGVNGRSDALSPAVPTMAELLRNAGYRTAGFSTNGNVASIYGFDRGFDVFRLVPGTIVPAPDGTLPAGAGPEAEAPRSSALNAEVLRWLDARRDSTPFFLYVHAADPHSPYTPAPAFRAQVGAPAGPPELGSLAMLARLKAQPTSADAPRAELLALYDGEVAENDARFGELLDGLRARGIYDDTVILFVSDHGEEFLEHGGWEHGRTLYTEVTHVPLLLKLARNDTERPLRVGTAVQLVDVLPTLLDYLGVTPPATLQGRSLLGRTRGDRTAPAPAFSHLAVDGVSLDSVVDGRWTLIQGSGDVELFDQETDPSERTNVAGDWPVTTEYLAGLLAERRVLGPPAFAATAPPMTDEVRRNLRALGYVQ